jgi:hypothetical protein
MVPPLENVLQYLPAMPVYGKVALSANINLLILPINRLTA